MNEENPFERSLSDEALNYERASERLEEELAGLAGILAQKRATAILEATAVKRCRDVGATWKDIAREYGTTRQAAYQRWGRRV